MYVCVCNAVTERDIGCAVAEGCCSLRDLREQLGVGACCGRCTDHAREVLRDSLHAHAPHRHNAAGQHLAAA
jgi:bacterioferritin-associated ferredoxin